MLGTAIRLCGKCRGIEFSANTQNTLFPKGLDFAENLSPNGERRASAKRRGLSPGGASQDQNRASARAADRASRDREAS